MSNNLDTFVANVSTVPNDFLADLILSSDLTESIRIAKALNKRQSFNIDELLAILHNDNDYESEVKLMYVLHYFFLSEPRYSKILENYKALLMISSHLSSYQDSLLRRSILIIAHDFLPQHRQPVIIDAYYILKKVLEEYNNFFPTDFYGEAVLFASLCAIDGSITARNKLADLYNMNKTPTVNIYFKAVLKGFSNRE